MSHEPDESIPVPRAALFDMLARLVAASRQIGLIDERSAHLAADAAQENVDHVGRQIAMLVGVPYSDRFGADPAKSKPLDPDDEPTVLDRPPRLPRPPGE
jgi:hypothetical protein